ncbi:nitroreductase family protein [Hyphococcus sp.]|uniref:nitroreductase family protein n=1 Tax=Hyphococcus sp. TaxID=2038636 RepID=UPI003CCBF853
MKKPNLGETLPASYQNEQTLHLLRFRRSTAADFLDGPGPDTETLADLLELAARAPDHRRVVPFRFIVFDGEGRQRFGDALASIFADQEPDVDKSRLEYERTRFLRAPVIVCVVSQINPIHKTPEWEQILVAGAVCQNLLIASSAYGFAAQWLTEWYAYDENIRTVLGLSEHERPAGFVYIGTAKESPKERGRPDMNAIVSRF